MSIVLSLLQIDKFVTSNCHVAYTYAGISNKLDFDDMPLNRKSIRPSQFAGEKERRNEDEVHVKLCV